MESMDNSLYYTFSTIAQSLAALIGLLSAIALFRLQSVGTELRDRGSKIGNSFGSHPILQDNLAREQYQKFLAGVQQAKDSGNVSFNAIETASLLRMTHLAKVQADILSSLKQAFLLSGAVIAASIAVLAHVHKLGDVQWLLWVGLTLLVLALGFQTLLVFRLLK